MTDKEDVLEGENARLRNLLRQAGVDAAASEVAQKLQQLLLAEMHHRIKNMLAMVQSIATQSLLKAKSLGDAREAISHRIMALSRTHDLLLGNDGESVRLGTLLDAVAEPFGQQRFAISVPDIAIPSATAISASLVFNELCTNAVKYGALSTPSGGIAVNGEFDRATKVLTVTWSEHGGPPVQQPSQRSFGTQLIEVALPGECKLEFRPDGVVCEMRLSISTT